MKENVVRNKSFEFAVSVANCCKVLVTHREFELAKQLLRAGTSIGANVREAGNSHSRREFTYRLTVALRECDETMFWLEVLRACKSLEEEKFNVLWSEAKDLFNILTRIIKTTRKNTPDK
jgi:four helix bundle protein